MMKKQLCLALVALLTSVSIQAKEVTDPVKFIKSMPYYQVVKELALSRCLAQVAEDDKTFSLDAARTANALRNWIPLNMEDGDERINHLIDEFKDAENPSHSEVKNPSKGVTLNCLRMYHSQKMDILSRQVIVGDANKSWDQENPLTLDAKK